MSPDDRAAQAIVAALRQHPSGDFGPSDVCDASMADLASRIVVALQAERAACAKILRDEVTWHRAQDDRIADARMRAGQGRVTRCSTGGACEAYGCDALLDIERRMLARGQE
ncbi:MAG TPA: hypothetical protein DCQ64_01260 [Candidatus Rokubacteria bacterium]|nr:hypothetical protein [Candidatus Rokubacteria bacterium]